MFKLLDLLYPNKCPFCNNIISNEKIISHKCFKESNKNNIVKEIHLGKNNFICVSPYNYSGPIKKSIWKFKFRNHKEYALYFGFSINQALNKLNPELTFDFITSVPISKERLLERGYNQTELFAKQIARMRNTKYKRLLIKTANNLPQHTLPAEERYKNVKGVYSIKKSGIMKNKKILLCDDIITTGNTICECRKVLLDTGASEVLCATIAVVP